MQVNQYTVNDHDIAQIAAFLRENHKKGERIAGSKDMLRAWAVDAEFQISEGNPASIEIRSFDAISGHTENFTVSDDGLDCIPVEIEE